MVTHITKHDEKAWSLGVQPPGMLLVLIQGIL